jgi:hypothetical protein
VHLQVKLWTVHVAAGYVQCGCQQQQSVHVVCWSVEWRIPVGSQGLTVKTYILVHVTGYRALVMELIVLLHFRLNEKQET